MGWWMFEEHMTIYMFAPVLGLLALLVDLAQARGKGRDFHISQHKLGPPLWMCVCVGESNRPDECGYTDDASLTLRTHGRTLKCLTMSTGDLAASWKPLMYRLTS